ncbi:MAG: hypothetical protein E6G22_00910 [Actinobacteria bacterium]|nr:MAG: hypothetical protein E6G22_00910 [Actinomycetota bacterium]
MHEAEVGVGGGDHLGEVGVGAERGHVVHQLRPELERALGDRRLGGVDRERHLAAEPLEHRDDAAQLLLGGNAGRPRPRRLAADVDDRRALRVEPPRRRGRLVRVEVDAAVEEGVWRDVDDAHDGRAREALLDRHRLHA